MTLPGQRNFSASRTDDEWAAAARAICAENGFPEGKPYRLQSSDHVVFVLHGGHVLKIFHRHRECFEREKRALAFVEGRLSIPTPEIAVTGSHEGLDYLIISRLTGRVASRHEFLFRPADDQIDMVTQLARVLRELHSIEPAGIPDDWHEFVTSQASSFIERQVAHGVNRQVRDALPEFLERNLSNVPLAPTVFLHGDVHFGNLKVSNAGVGPWLCGLFDFADSRRGWHEYDFVAVGVLMIQGERDLQRRFFLEYGYAEADLDEQMRERMMMLTMLYETADLRRYALRLRPEAVDYTLDRLMREIWSFV